MVTRGEARHGLAGKARLGTVWLVAARLGQLRQVMAGKASQGTVGRGLVRFVEAGEAWLGWLRYIAVLQGMFWSVWAGGVR